MNLNYQYEQVCLIEDLARRLNLKTDQCEIELLKVHVLKLTEREKLRVAKLCKIEGYKNERVKEI